jgi:FAD/FMN-containing dehydrogenase
MFCASQGRPFIAALQGGTAAVDAPRVLRTAPLQQRPQRRHDAFPGPTLTRLRELKAVYDPQNVFNQNFPIDSVS